MSRSTPDRRSRGEGAPGPRGWPLFGVLPSLARDPMGYTAKAFTRFGDVVALPVGPVTVYAICNPEHVKHVLLDHHKNYGKGKMWDALRRAIGNSLPTSEGDYWLRQRRIMQPAFHRKRLGTLTALMVSAVEGALPRFESLATNRAEIDVNSEMKHLTSDILLRTMFGTSLRAEETALMDQSVVTMMEGLSRLMWTVILPSLVPFPGKSRFQGAIRTIRSVVKRVIEERRHGKSDADDLLSMLLAARDEESGESMSDEQLRDEVIAMMIAGYETTSLALTWTWYALSQYADAAHRVHDEIDAVLGGRAPSFDDLSRLTRTRMFFEETMRFYSPGWAIPRQAIADDELGGHSIPAGSILLICHHVTARHASVWETPDAFDPEHFAADRVATRSRFAYLPFGAGPRHCIGSYFAIMEAQVILAMLGGRYSFEPTSKVRQRAVNVMIHPEPRLVMKLSRRIVEGRPLA